MKFKHKQDKPTIISFYGKQDTRLIRLGDICLYKEEQKQKSYCNDYYKYCYGNYYRIQSALCGKTGSEKNGKKFTPKRILIIQMI